LAYAEGLLTSPNLGTLQEFCLKTYLARKEIEALEKDEEDFEKQLFLHRPEVYEEYMKDKKEKEELGYDHIVWKEPETLEEAELIFNAIRISEKASKDYTENEKTNNKIDDSIELNFLKQFEGIDISQIGEEDGG
jgi:hypothetical protein